MPAVLIVQLVLGVLAALPSLIQAAEALHTQAGAGPLKKTFVLDAIGKSLSIVPLIDPKIGKIFTPDIQAKVQASLGPAIDQAVAVMNAQAPAPAPRP